MRSRSVTVGYALTVVVAVAFAFLFVRAADAIDPVWNEGWQLRIDGEAAPRVPASEVYRELAATSGVDVVRVVADDEHPARVRHLFAAGGGQAGEWLRDGYSTVDPAMTTTVAPLIDLGSRDVRGLYLVGGDRGAAERVLAVIEHAGWDGDVHPYAAALDLDTYREHGDLMRIFAVGLLTVVVLVGAGTVLRSRAHGIQRLHGAGTGGILLGEGRALLGPVLLLALAGLGSVVAVVAMRDELAQLPTVLGLAGRLFVLLLASALAAHVVGVALTDGRALVDQVKGAIDGWWVLVATYAVRVPAVLVLLAVVAALGQSARVAEVESRTRDFWDVAGDAVVLGIAGYRSRDEVQAQTADLARLAASQADAGELVLAYSEEVGNAQILYVDQGYLDRVPILDARGGRVTRALPDAITVLVPEGASEERRAAAVTGIESTRDIQAQVSDGVPTTPQLPLIERAIAPQTLPTFRSPQAGLNQLETRIVDPIVAVLPSTEVLAPSELLAFTTQGAVVFTDPESTRAEIEARGMSDFVAFIEPVAYRADEEYRRALGSLSLNLMGLAGASLVVLLSGLVAAVVTVEKDRRRAFVHRLSGLRPLSAHRGALILESVLLAGVTVLAVVPIWLRDPTDVSTVLDLAGADSIAVLVEQSALGLAATVASAALFVACLALAQRRSARARSADA